MATWQGERKCDCGLYEGTIPATEKGAWGKSYNPKAG